MQKLKVRATPVMLFAIGVFAATGGAWRRS